MGVQRVDGLKGKILLKWMMTGGTPMTQETPIYIYIHMYIHTKSVYNSIGNDLIFHSNACEITATHSGPLTLDQVIVSTAMSG